MDRDTALKLLRAGEEGIREWNRRREAGEEIPELCSALLFQADLFHANLSGVNLSEADVSEADLSEANLSNASVSGTDFNHASLISANLGSANLSGASLFGANLGGANLRAANLRGVNLSIADLGHANLSGADLGHAILSQANLYRNNLRGVNLGEVFCSWSIFADVDLSEVIGLDSVKHEGPSTIGIDTLLRSKGKIPEAFLRGCGVPDAFIAYLPSIMGAMQPIQLYSCFISYSSKNQEFADRLHADLQAKGVRCWFDREDLKIGDKIRPRITEAIRVHDKLMLVLTEHSIASEWVEGEVEAALERERREKRTVLFPIRLDDSVMESSIGWASHIRQTRHIGDFREWLNQDAYEKAFERLLRDLKAEESTGAKQD